MNLIIKMFLLFICAVLILSPYDVNAQNKTLTTNQLTESEALKIAHKWATLVSEEDTASLDKLISGNYLHIHSSALVETKQQFIDALKTGIRNYEPIVFEDLLVRLFGNTAIVTGKFNLKVTARGKIIEGINRFGMVITGTIDGIQVVSYQATSIAQQK